MIDEERLVAALLELIQIDSETGHEDTIAKKLIRRFTELGLDIKEDEAKALTGLGSNNLVCTLKGSEDYDPIYFTAHMDTVVPGNGVKPVVKDGLIRSDGTTILGSDDKAGLAAICEVLQVIKEKQLPHGTMQFVLTVGEEAGLAGSKVLDPSLLHAKYGFALDSDGPVGDVVVAAPCQAKMTIHVFGKTAHAGIEPEKGISAIKIAAKAIAQVPDGRIDEETTANIGCIEGGRATNIVCDSVKIEAEARSMERAKLDQLIDTIKTQFEETAEQMGGRAKISVRHLYPSYRFSEDDQVVRIAQEAIRNIGRTPRLFRSGGGSDANMISGFGIPSVNLGVGYQDIHTKDEVMPIEELVKTSELILSIIEQSGKHK